MSLTKVRLSEIVKYQYQFKLRSYIDLLNPLIFMQLIAVLFSLGGIGQGSRGSIDLNIHYYTTDYVVVFTMIWAFVIGIQLTSAKYREQSVAFVTNHLTESISNIFFLLTVSAIGGTLAFLSRFLTQVIVRFILKFDQVFGVGTLIPITEFLMGFVAIILFIFMFGSLGYIVGNLVQLNKLFIVVIPILIVGLILYYGSATELPLAKNVMYRLFVFYFQEKVFTLFLLKAIITSMIFNIGSYLISNRLEVQ